MDTVRQPLTRLALRAASRAQDLGFVALADVARATEDPDGLRLIGGQMITLHAYRWSLGAELFRESKDADVGVTEALVRDGGFIQRLEGMGYKQRRGGEFVRPLFEEAENGGDPPEAAIDVLVPARTSRARASRQIATHLVTSEVPGLATALRRPPVPVELAMTRLDETRLTATIILPDEVATLVLRAHAWRTRLTDTDAEDLWRSLEIAYAAGVAPSDFRTADERRAGAITREAFERDGGMASLAVGNRIGRVRALIARVLGP